MALLPSINLTHCELCDWASTQLSTLWTKSFQCIFEQYYLIGPPQGAKGLECTLILRVVVQLKLLLSFLREVVKTIVHRQDQLLHKKNGGVSSFSPSLPPSCCCILSSLLLVQKVQGFCFSENDSFMQTKKLKSNLKC